VIRDRHTVLGLGMIQCKMASRCMVDEEAVPFQDLDDFSGSETRDPRHAPKIDGTGESRSLR